MMYGRKLTARVPVHIAEYITAEAVRGGINRQELVAQLIVHGLNDLLERQAASKKPTVQEDTDEVLPSDDPSAK